MFKFRQNDIVDFDNGFVSGRGLIKGVASMEMPTVGVTYIIQVIDGSLPTEVV